MIMSTEMLQKRARRLMWLVTVPFALLSILAAMLVGNIAWYGVRVAHADLVAIYYFPMLLYMWAIWMVRSALKQVATGALFSHVVPRLLSRVGTALFGGALFTVIGVPLVTAWAFGRPHIATFEPSPITLGVVGASLVIFSHLLGGAASMRDELDRFF
jgi:hypothetical protein